MEATDEQIVEFLTKPRKIAIVGASSKPERTSNEISLFLKEKGHKLIPIHPKEKEVLGDPVIPSLADLNEPVDGVILYLNEKIVGEQAKVAAEKGIPLIWLPLGVRSEEARKAAEEKGLLFVEDKCPKIEWRKLVEKTN